MNSELKERLSALEDNLPTEKGLAARRSRTQKWLIASTALVASIGTILAIAVVQDWVPIASPSSGGHPGSSVDIAPSASATPLQSIATSTAAGSPTTTETNLPGNFVGTVDFISGCALLLTSDEAYELRLPDGYQVDANEDGAFRILGPDGTVVAKAGDRLGVDGSINDAAGSFCMLGPVLEVSHVHLAP